MRLLAAFITCLDSKPFPVCRTGFLSKDFFLLSYLQPLERRCSLTRGVRERLIYLARISLVQYTLEPCGNATEF